MEVVGRISTLSIQSIAYSYYATIDEDTLSRPAGLARDRLPVAFLCSSVSSICCCVLLCYAKDTLMLGQSIHDFYRR